MADAPIPSPPSDFDTAWKLTLETYLVEFCDFLFPPVYAGIDWSRGYEFLDTELQQVTAESDAGRGTVDKLVKAWAADGTEEWLLIHVEVQSQAEQDFAARMFRYHYRLLDRYGRDVVSLAVLGDDRPQWRPGEYVRDRLGCGLRFAYPVAKLLDYQGRDEWLTTHPNPLAAIVQGHLEAMDTRQDAVDRTGRKVRLARSLYGRGLSKEDIRRLFWLLDWIVTLPPDLNLRFNEEIKMNTTTTEWPLSPIQKLWLSQGKEEGLKEGIEQGIEQGRQQAKVEFRLNAIQLMLPAKFGADGAALLPRVNAIADPALLDRILLAVGTAATLDDVRSQLP